MLGVEVDVQFLPGAIDPARVLRAIVEHAENAIVAKDRDGIIRAWNPAAERIFGYSAAEAVGHSILLVIPPDRHHEEADIMARLRRGELIRDFETLRQRRDGSFVEVELTISPILGAGDTLIGAVKIVSDLTEQRTTQAALAAEESRFRTLADNISQLAWMADASGWIFWYNRRWFEYTGTTLEASQGWGWRAVHHPDHVDRVVSRISHCWQTGEPWEDTFPIRGRDGAYRWFLSRALPIRDENGDIVRWFGTNTDVTEQRRLEAALAASNERKDAFLATLSHELRNPLGAVRTAVAAMQSAPGDRAVMDRALPIVSRQCTHVSRLLDDLLDVSRIARDRLALQLRDSDAVTILSNTVDAMRPALEAAGLRFETRLPASPVIAQPDDIFELFVQGPGNDQTSGLGIGLSLVRRLAVLHGGSAHARSDGPGRGSTFTVRLPSGQEGPRLAAQEPRPDVVLLDLGLPDITGEETCRRLRGDGLTSQIVAVTGWGQQEDFDRTRPRASTVTS